MVRDQEKALGCGKWDLEDPWQVIEEVNVEKEKYKYTF